MDTNIKTVVDSQWRVDNLLHYWPRHGHANGDDASASIYIYAGIPWIIILPIILKYYGRKKTYIFVTLGTFIGFVIFYSSNSLFMYIVSEIVHGINSASHMTTAVILITEYTSPKYRGVFLTWKSATFFWGLWVANALGTFFHWKTIGLIGMASSGYGLLIVVFWPESPYWLAANGKFEECAKAYKWLNGNNEESERNLEKLITYQREQHKSGQLKGKDYLRNLYQIITGKPFYKPVVLSVLILSLYVFSGKLIISLYAVETISIITEKSAVYSGMLILDGTTVLSMYVGASLSKVLRRRTLLLTASSLGIGFLLTMSFYLFLIKSSVVSENKYVSVMILMGYSITISSGPMILTSTISGEMISLESRSLCVCLIAMIYKLLSGTLVKVSPYIYKTLGVHGTFLFFGISSSVFLFLIYKFIPETKDKTLQEIAEYMQGVKNNSSSREIKEMMPVKTRNMDT